MARGQAVPLIRAGAEDPLPAEYLWLDGGGYWIYPAEQPRSSWREHSHDCAQVSIGLEAHARMEWRPDSQGSARREMSGNIVSVIPAGEPHRTLWERRASLVTVYLCTEFLSAAASEISRETRLKLNLEAAHLVRDSLIEELGRALYYEYREYEGRAISRRFADSVVMVLATHLVRKYNASADAPPEFRGGLGPATSRRVRRHIEQSLGGDLSIEALAKISGLSPNYFAEGFKRTTGFTPHQYVSRRRVDEARQLLMDTDLPLSEVAHRCGFKSQSQFTTVFHRFTGMTPGKFRAEHEAAE